MSMWIVPAIHMRILLQFSSAVFLNSGPHLVHLFYCEQACVFKFLDFSVIPKHRLCFIYCDTSFDGWSIASLLICLNLFPFFSLPLLFSQPPFFFFPLCFFFSEFSHPSLSPHNPSFMSPAKSEGSSHHKGKKVVIDDPPIEAKKGEEAPHSKSDHYKQEEGTRNPGNECPPLIDPWYDTHSRFPVVLDDYSCPPSGRVWLSLEWRDSKFSWALLACSIPYLTIR